jgi:hypothetical protein
MVLLHPETGIDCFWWNKLTGTREYGEANKTKQGSKHTHRLYGTGNYLIRITINHWQSAPELKYALFGRLISLHFHTDDAFH